MTIDETPIEHTEANSPRSPVDIEAIMAQRLRLVEAATNQTSHSHKSLADKDHTDVPTRSRRCRKLLVGAGSGGNPTGHNHVEAGQSDVSGPADFVVVSQEDVSSEGSVLPTLNSAQISDSFSAREAEPWDGFSVEHTVVEKRLRAIGLGSTLEIKREIFLRRSVPQGKLPIY